MPSPRYYLVSYDISDRERYREVHKIIKGYGRRIHYSVFACELTPRKKIELQEQLHDAIHHEEDRILILDAGEVERDPEKLITLLGKNPDLTEEESAVV